MTDKTYEKLYLQTKKQLDDILKHRRHEVKKCKYCREWYEGIIEETNKIKNKEVRESLLEVWETLWLNNCRDFDIIASMFNVE